MTKLAAIVSLVLGFSLQTQAQAPVQVPDEVKPVVIGGDEANAVRSYLNAQEYAQNRDGHRIDQPRCYTYISPRTKLLSYQCRVQGIQGHLHILEGDKAKELYSLMKNDFRARDGRPGLEEVPLQNSTFLTEIKAHTIFCNAYADAKNVSCWADKISPVAQTPTRATRATQASHVSNCAPSSPSSPSQQFAEIQKILGSMSTL